MVAKSALLMTCLMVLGLSIDPPAAAGQVTASDTTGAAADSQPAPTDTAGASVDSVPGADTARDTTTASDTVAADTTAGIDTTTAADTSTRSNTTASSDTTAVGDTTAGSATATAEPGDSILNAACSGSVTVARDLLVIVFAPEAGKGERSAVAESVEGRLLGPVGSGEPGAYYLRVPSEGDEYRLRTAADQLIQQANVRQVGSRACPPPPPPEKVQQKPS